MPATWEQLGTPNQLANNQPCWWMLAGVVDYKLCDRDFDCEHCPFDLILHGGAESRSDLTTATEDVAPEELSEAVRSASGLVAGQNFDLIDSLFYHPAHVWVRVEDHGNVRIGLDDFAQKILGRAYAVSLPHEGLNLENGKHCWSVTHKAGQTNLIIPLSGVVIEVNWKLTQVPSLLNRDPYGAGWAFMIKPTDLEAGLGNLFYGSEATNWHRSQAEKLYVRASELLGSGSVAGATTMPDGGTFKKDFLSELSAEQMRELINSFLPPRLGDERARNRQSAILSTKRR